MIYTTSTFSSFSILPIAHVICVPSLADSLVVDTSLSPLTEERTLDSSKEKVPGTTSCNAKSSRALSELLSNISKISYLPGPPPGNTCFPVLMFLLR